MILMVDDEQWRNDSYIQELRVSYEVIYERDVDATWRQFEAHITTIEAAIIDIMLAPGKRYAHEITGLDGLRTGILLYRDLRKVKPDLPVIFLTNVRYDLVSSELEGETNYLFLRKLDYLPHTVPEQLDSLLKQTTSH